MVDVSSNMSAPYRPIESRREEFQEYLERSGVLDTITKVFLMLYEEPERPDNPIDYVRRNLMANNPDAEEIEQLKPKIEKANAKLAQLKKTRDELKTLLEEAEIKFGGFDDNYDSSIANNIVIDNIVERIEQYSKNIEDNAVCDKEEIWFSEDEGSVESNKTTDSELI
ncbi:c-Myc-binding protein-like [Daktulosphaira vitifoliae]|uniref:c-Myc-binding protein-like n=1 Tax=Daktulosphaira vitifoliae TaxID=58002 RepID=UPI0021AA0066|nr:c-Myc-binding protein-like [Daktulosphaira vitifoliae]